MKSSKVRTEAGRGGWRVKAQAQQNILNDSSRKQITHVLKEAPA